MFKDKKPLIIGGALVGVLLVAGGGFLLWRQKKSGGSIGIPEKDWEQQGERREPLVVPPSAEEMPYETFATADGNLSFEIPSAWTRTEIQNLETVLPKSFIDKYQMTMPLILSDPRGAQASLSTYRFEKGLDLDAVMDALAAELVNLGQPYNEVGRGTVGDSLVVDSTVDTQGVTVQVRDILFSVLEADENIIYNLSFSARQSNWGEYETIFDHIQTTAQLSL